MKKPKKENNVLWLRKHNKGMLFFVSLTVILIGVIINYFVVKDSQTNLNLILSLFTSAWIIVTIIVTAYELLFTDKKVLYALWPFLIVLISIFVPILNLVVFLPIAYYLIIKNMYRAVKQPKEFGGIPLSVLAFGFATITLIKTIEVYIMYYNGTIIF